jgi:hypothetical protein
MQPSTALVAAAANCTSSLIPRDSNLEESPGSIERYEF